MVETQNLMCKDFMNLSKYSRKKIEIHLHEDEDILCIEIPSWFKYRYTFLLTPLLFPLIIAGLKIHTNYLIVTNKRVLTIDGVLSENSKGVSYPNLTTVKVHQDIMAKFFNYGYLHIHTKTGGLADINFHYLRNPIRIKKEIEKKISEFEKGEEFID